MSGKKPPVYEGFPDGVTDGFVEHAAKSRGQYDTTCRALASEVVRHRAELQLLSAQLAQAKREYQDAMEAVRINAETIGLMQDQRDKARAEARPPWVLVTERLPDVDGSRWIVQTKGKWCMAAMWFGPSERHPNGWWCGQGDGVLIRGVVAYQPLPAPAEIP